MAKKPDVPIKEADLKEYLGSRADFAFEMKVLKALRDLGFECEHGGTYRDPITDKVRQFDIRAHQRSPNFHIELAVECKNLRESRPLLLHAVARREPEAYHQLIVRGQVPKAHTHTKRITAHESAYRPGEFVAKDTDQVGRNPQSGEFLTSDYEVFDKVTQAVNSSCDLVRKSYQRVEPAQACAIIPMLVVPDGTLWQVEYADDGAIAAGPQQVQSSTLFIDQTWDAATLLGSESYSISHLEIVTISALKARTDYLIGNRGVFALMGALFR